MKKQYFNDMIPALNEVERLTNDTMRDIHNLGTREFVCEAMVDRLDSIIFKLKHEAKKARALREAGIRKDGWHYDAYGESGIRWFVLDHLGHDDEELIRAIETAIDEMLCAYAPCSPYDCTGKPIGGDARIQRGRKIAVVTQWRGIDV